MKKIIPQDSFTAAHYTSQPVTLSHPDHLYVVGRLHGLTPRRVENARVLELGCGAGGNILPMAATIPGGRFVGIDLSERKIEMAKVAAAAGGLMNIDLLAGDAMVVLKEVEGLAFDYIVLHSQFSGVPVEVQNTLLPFCRRLLSDLGILYVSYNTYPGGHGRELVRAFMLRARAGIDRPEEQVSVARCALNDLKAAYAQADDSFAKLLEEEKTRIDDMDDSLLMHDLFEIENHPIYVDDFIARAHEAGLQYISESNMAASREENFSPEAQRQLSTVTNTVQREQLIDFILNRSFRQTLLCRRGPAVQRQIAPSPLSEFHMASPLLPMGQDEGGAPGEAFFATPDGGRIGITIPKAITALNHLALAWPGFLPALDLAERIGDSAILAKLAIDLYPRNWLDLLPRLPQFTTTPGKFPMTTELARWQVGQGETVTDLRHRKVNVTDEFTRQLIPLLDGQSDRQNLMVAASEFNRDPDMLVANCDPESELNSTLFQLAERCLLVQ